MRKLLIRFAPEKTIISPNDNINPKTYGPVMKMRLNKSEKIINKVNNKNYLLKDLISFLY